MPRNDRRRRFGGRLAPAAILAAIGAALAAQGADPEPLKSLAPRGLLLGAAMNTRQVTGADPAASAIVERHYNTVTAENALKWGPVHPEPGRYNFKPADAFVEYAARHGLVTIGHVLVWHQQTPPWVFAGEGGARASRDVLLARMRDHITTVVGRYRGRIRGWDVVNEAIEEDGSLRPSPWLGIIGEDFIAKAFEFAHAADPEAELYYNDYNLWKPEKLAGAVRIVTALRARGLRVDGIGEQGHWLIDEPSIPQIEATLDTIAKAGVRAYITELDVDVLPRDPGMYGADLSKQAEYQASTNLYPTGLPEAVQQRLARRYAEIFRVFVARRAALDRVTFWGVTDASSWLNGFPVRGRVNHPLLFDRQGQPKPAFQAVADVLRTAR